MKLDILKLGVLTVTGLLNQHVDIYLLVTQYTPSISEPLLHTEDLACSFTRTINNTRTLWDVCDAQLNSFATVSTSQNLPVV
jgi:hypothetical protein